MVGAGGESSAGGGVLVSRVGGQALALGVHPGDAIDSIGPQRVGSATRPEVVAIFKGAGAGRPLVVRFRRRRASVAAGRGADERRRSGVARVAAEAWSANAEPLRPSGRSSSASCSSSACSTSSRRGSRGGVSSPDRPTRRKKALSRESGFLTLHEKGPAEAALPEAVPEEAEEGGGARAEPQLQQPRKKASSSVGRGEADGGMGVKSGAAAAAPRPRGCCNIS